jgi:prepilin-type processing-associated H-X9-DG protein
MEWIFGLSCAFAVLTLLGRAVGDAREAARRSQCLGNFSQLELALHNYHQSYGSFPPAYIADAAGRPMHSWRVLVLPFMEQGGLYNQYNFAEPWNGPNNRALLGQMPAIFSCPTRDGVPTSFTKVVAISGPGTMFPGARPVAFGEITDGPADTAMIAEVSNMEIPWTAPVDLDVRTMCFTINDPRGPGISSPHPGGAHIGFGDGRTYFVHSGLPTDTLRALTTIAGGEKIKADEALHAR